MIYIIIPNYMLSLNQRDNIIDLPNGVEVRIILVDYNGHTDIVNTSKQASNIVLDYLDAHEYVMYTT